MHNNPITNYDVFDIEKQQFLSPFICKIYITLTLQLTTTFLMSLLIYNNDSMTNYVLENTTLLWVSIIFTFVFLFMGMPSCLPKPYNLIALIGFTLCESYSVAYISIYYTASSVIIAWGMTISTFIFLTIYVLKTKEDFQFLGAGLYSCLWISIMGGIIQLIIIPDNPLLNTILASLGTMIAIGYILYDTSDIIYRIDKDDYVFACMSLYIDIIMLFTKLIELVGDRRLSN